MARVAFVVAAVLLLGSAGMPTSTGGGTSSGSRGEIAPKSYMGSPVAQPPVQSPETCEWKGGGWHDGGSWKGGDWHDGGWWQSDSETGTDAGGGWKWVKVRKSKEAKS
jgi:hypothetical protein